MVMTMEKQTTEETRIQAAEELDAVVAFELTKTEGGLDGGYTGQTPELFASTVIDYAELTRQGISLP